MFNFSLANDIQPGHDNDIYLSGYSDQILRFIAERGDSGQLIHVDNIDAAYSLKAAPLGQAEKKVEPTVASVQRYLFSRLQTQFLGQFTGIFDISIHL